MDTQQNTALTRALAEVPGPLPASGVIHIVIPHTSRFTVVGNHLAQHPDLSCTAVGIAVRIQSLPPGARVGIKELAARCREGEKRVAAALRELEACGYLQRARVRLPGGRIVTRTVFCNQPTALLRPRHPHAAVQQRPAPVQAQAEAQPPAPAPAPTQASAPAPAAPAARPVTPPAPPPPLTSPPAPPQPPALPFVPLVPPPTAPKPPPTPLPRPSGATPELDRAATALLGDLRRHAPQFTLSETDIRQLAPGVAAWLERDAHPDTIRHTLTNDPPHPLRHPAKLLRHRLTALLPPPLPGSLDLVAPTRPRIAVTPFQTCDDCDRAYRTEDRAGRTEDRAGRTEGVRTAA
ncbi:hypothetical protein [Streptomyces sp. NPDC096095]|uniref:hypothetical protein n=1 Tax=Streptomyces sp. NPDC096095 TaxID=3155545 RepID=UPI00331D8F0E